MNNLANLSKYIGHSDWSEEQTPVTTEPQMAATYKQEKPQGLAKKLGVKKTVQSIFWTSILQNIVHALLNIWGDWYLLQFHISIDYTQCVIT